MSCRFCKSVPTAVMSTTQCTEDPAWGRGGVFRRRELVLTVVHVDDRRGRRANDEQAPRS